MYAHRNSSIAFTAKSSNPQNSPINFAMSVSLSVQTTQPHQSNFTLYRFPTVKRHSTAAVNIGHFALLGKTTPGISDPDRSTNKQTDMAGPAHILFYSNAAAAHTYRQ
jgi:hypothetical protein